MMDPFAPVSNYLQRVRPVGWLEELKKLENTANLEGSAHLIGAESWQVKMRMLNRDLILPRQVIEHKITPYFDIPSPDHALP